METKKIYAPHELLPSVLVHPGEMLKVELEARGISQRKFAPDKCIIFGTE